MFSYEFYKIVHLAAVLTFVSMTSVYFFQEKAPKLVRVLSGIATLFILVAGMGLLARIGVSHGEPWPNWVKIKVLIWLSSGILVPVLGKRLGRFRILMFFVFLGLFILAGSLAVTKI